MRRNIIVKVYETSGAWRSQIGEIDGSDHASERAAINSAIDMANLLGRMGRPAEVRSSVQGLPSDAIWTYGVDCYPPKL